MKQFLTLTIAAAMVLTSGISETALAQHGRRPPSGGSRGYSPTYPTSHHYAGGPRGCAPAYPTTYYRSSHRSSSGWSSAGYVLAGVVAGSFLQSTCVSQPTRREVVTYQTVYQQPTVVQEVRYVQPQVVIREVPVREPVYVTQPTAPQEVSTKETIWVQNSNGSQIPVELRRSGSLYIGPKGEYYGTLPTNEQLRLLYGM